MAYLLKVGKSCNNNCLVCPYLGMKADHDRSLSELESEIAPLPDADIDLPCNTDFRKDFPEILDMLKKHRKKVRLECNGRVFSYPSQRANLTSIASVRIHIFGTDPSTHDRITQVPGSHRQAMQGFANLGKAAVLFRWHSPYVTAQDKPDSVVIELTAKCNFDCIGCFNKASFAKLDREKPEMTTEYVKDVIDSVAEAGIPVLRFSGGEPLLRDDLFELMAYARSKGLNVWLNTNASLVDEEIAERLGKYVENILIATNAVDEKSHKGWTNKGSYGDVKKGTGNLRKVGIKVVRTGTVMTNENIKNLSLLAEEVRDFDDWELWRPIPLNKNDPSPDASMIIDSIIRTSLVYGRQVRVLNAIPFCSSDMDVMDLICAGACHDDGHTRVVVDPRGFAKPSYFLEENIGDPRDIMACWNHPFMKKMRNLEFLPERCRSCRYRQKCKGGSRYAANLVHDSYTAEDPLMPATF